MHGNLYHGRANPRPYGFYYKFSSKTSSLPHQKLFYTSFKRGRVAARTHRLKCIAGILLLPLLAAGCSSQEVSAPLASPTPQPAPGRIEYPASDIRDLSEEFGLAYPDPLSVDYPDAYTLPGIAASALRIIRYCPKSKGSARRCLCCFIAPCFRRSGCTDTECRFVRQGEGGGPLNKCNTASG